MASAAAGHPRADILLSRRKKIHAVAASADIGDSAYKNYMELFDTQEVRRSY